MMMNSASEIALAIGSSLGLAILAKATLATVVAFVVARLCHGSRASLRHLVFAVAFGVLLLLPVAALVMPSVALEVTVASTGDAAPSTTSNRYEALFVSAAETKSSEGDVTQANSLSLQGVFGVVWLLGVLIFLTPVASGLWQLRCVRRFGLP